MRRRLVGVSSAVRNGIIRGEDRRSRSGSKADVIGRHRSRETANRGRGKGETSMESALAAADELLRKVPLIDGHNDLAWAVRRNGHLGVADLDRLQPSLQTDLVRLHSGRVGGQFWSVYVPCRFKGSDAIAATSRRAYTPLVVSDSEMPWLSGQLPTERLARACNTAYFIPADTLRTGATVGPSHRAVRTPGSTARTDPRPTARTDPRPRRDQEWSNKSRFMTLSHADANAHTNFSSASWLA